MANSQDTEKNRIRFKVLDALYSISKGYKYTFIPFDILYKELQSNSDREQEVILEGFQLLRNYGLVDTKALATASITHQGIKKLESLILGSDEHTTPYLSYTDEPQTNKNEIRTIQNQRTLFLKKAYELSEGSNKKPISAFKIMDILGYDKETLERIYYYLEEEGLIKTFALGGEFTI